MRFFLSPLMMLLAVAPTFALADSMRCNQRLVGKGTSQYEVLLHCGEPAFMQIVREPVLVQRVTQAQIDRPGSRVRSEQLNALESETQYIEIERWTYHPSSGRLIREVDFLNGKIKRINTTGRAP